ncbi:GNAT family N-acetyltransferase [Nocardioides bizhenqiangii]|uniref:GNAT family N-acetyltransferase n=1 Tax=Nocardioides bizhenqiangii TaxID=3095076 RepID=A0ABZ0ZLG4_9ACTN|nr:GNAT family N-acetyltransferase [Nocardioides sp. HM61]WQQ25100.1 GNAT family N-acetyltransferase [Nocardioides sp. HM61]
MTTADVSVRVAWSQDAAAIAAVQLRAWERRYDALLPSLLAERGLDPETHAAAWQASLTRPPEARHRALVALERVRVVGFALTGPATDPDADPAVDGEIGEFTIDPGHLRQGHGSRLLQAAVDTLLADGFTRVTTWVDSTDDALRAFLTSAGWDADGATRELADETGAGTVKQVRLHTATA